MKRVKIALAVLAAALLGVIVWQVWPPGEPVYEGKRLSEWLRQYHMNYRGGIGDKSELEEQAAIAIRQIGTNALPALLQLLRAKDSPLKVKLMALAQRQHIIKIQYTTAEDWRWPAARGFEVLGAKAQHAVPALIEIANQNISGSSQEWAVMALRYIGPSAKDALPSLLQCATNANLRVRYQAIWALGSIKTEPDRVVPVMTNALHDPDPDIQFIALWTIGEFDFVPSAKLAVPALLQFLNATQDASDKTLAAHILKAIDPEAAAEAGVANIDGNPSLPP